MILTEPWVTQPQTAECRAALAAAVLDPDPTSGADSAACDWRRAYWDPSAYSRAITALGEMSGGVTGVYAFSFGAVPGSLAAAELQARWAVFEAPAPPPGTPLEAVLSARATAAEKAIKCVAEPACFDVDGSRGDSLLRAYAYLGLAAALPFSADAIEHVQESGISPTDPTVRAAGEKFIRASADGLVDSGLAAYLGGVCAAYPDSQPIPQSSRPALCATITSWQLRHDRRRVERAISGPGHIRLPSQPE